MSDLQQRIARSSSEVSSSDILEKFGSGNFRVEMNPLKNKDPFSTGNMASKSSSRILPDILTKYSSKLLATMQKDRCQGDFCGFRVIQSYE